MTSQIKTPPHGKQGHLFVNLMATDGLERQGARALAAIVLTYSYRNTPLSVSEVTM